MGKYTVEDIRNIALAGHGSAGKTLLADTLLYHGKAADRVGTVEEGNSLSDFDEEEKKRQFSIYNSVLHLDHEGKHINLIDTPGYPDFVGSAIGALDAVENVAVVIAAPNGIQVNTRRLFNEAGKRELGRMIVLNKLDSDNLKFEEILSNIKGTFGNNCVLFNIPNGIGGDFTEVVSVLNPPDSAPANAPIGLDEARSALIDAIVETDEELMMQYLEEGTISEEDLQSALPKALASGSCIPIFCTSAKNDTGVKELLDAFVSLALSPAQGKKRTLVTGEGDDRQESELEADPSKPCYAQVFKAINDKFVGNLSFLRIHQGTLSSSQNLVIARTDNSARNTGLMKIQGKAQEPVDEAIAGDIVAVAKIDDLHIGDTVRTDAKGGSIVKNAYPTPMFGLAVEPKARGDEQKISTSLSKVSEEDPTFRVSRDAQTKELVITGMSQLHLEVVQSQLKRRYDLEIITHEPKIPYRETITMQAEDSHRHKKQSGGRGQFGEVHLRVYSLSHIKDEEQFTEEFATKSKFEKMRNANYDAVHNFGFVDSIVGGTIPNQFVPAVEKGCKELLDRGALAGYQMQDVAAEVHFGKDHPVDSSEAAFKMAGKLAFKKACLKASPVLLEPIVDLEVTVPTSSTGDIQSLLTTKRARIEDQEYLPGDIVILKAKAPLAEVTRLQAELGSLTGGQGSYSMEFSHYEAVPPNVQQQIVAKAQVDHEEED